MFRKVPGCSGVLHFLFFRAIVDVDVDPLMRAKLGRARPWEGVVEGTAGGINRDDQNLNSLQEILLKSMPFWTEPRTDECHFLSLKLSSICCALMNSIVPRPIRCWRCWSN